MSDDLERWLAAHTARGPARLRERVLEQARAVPPQSTVAGTLALAARALLGQVTAHPGDRSVALDLLAADALLTLALLAQAESAPERLGEFATAVLHAVRPGT